MSTATIEHSTPDGELAQAARLFLTAALRTMSSETRATFDTYQRLAAHEERFAATASDNGRHEAADRALKQAEQYRADAFGMVARLPLAAVSRGIGI